MQEKLSWLQTFKLLVFGIFISYFFSQPYMQAVIEYSGGSILDLIKSLIKNALFTLHPLTIIGNLFLYKDFIPVLVLVYTVFIFLTRIKVLSKILIFFLLLLFLANSALVFYRLSTSDFVARYFEAHSQSILMFAAVSLLPLVISAAGFKFSKLLTFLIFYLAIVVIGIVSLLPFFSNTRVHALEEQKLRQQEAEKRANIKSTFNYLSPTFLPEAVREESKYEELREDEVNLTYQCRQQLGQERAVGFSIDQLVSNARRNEAKDYYANYGDFPIVEKHLVLGRQAFYYRSTIMRTQVLLWDAEDSTVIIQNDGRDCREEIAKEDLFKTANSLK